MQRAPARPTQNTDSDPEFEGVCIALFASVAAAFSVPKSIGQIYGLLYASPAPLSFSEILSRLEISKGSVSQGLGLLKNLGAVQELPVSSKELDSLPVLGLGDPARSARALYAPELSLRRLVGGILSGRLMALAGEGAAQVEQLVSLANRSVENQEFYRGQAARVVGWKRQLGLVLPLLSTLLGPQTSRHRVRRKAQRA